MLRVSDGLWKQDIMSVPQGAKGKYLMLIVFLCVERRYILEIICTMPVKTNILHNISYNHTLET